jgi:glycerophosphoryl diester phosphodiesterase
MSSVPADKHRPVIGGHRGAAGLAPENTVPSFRRAIDLGVAWVELDVRLTADGHPVCLHDESLDRTTSASGPVAAITLAELGTVVVHPLPGAATTDVVKSTPTGVRVPTLDEALRAICPDAGCLIELKRDDARERDLVRAVIAAVEASACGVHVRLISFEESLLGEARRQAPQLPRGIIGSRDLDELFAAAERTECAALHAGLMLVEPGLADRCARAGLRLHAWTANDSATIRRLADLGVEEITTDFPDLAVETLAQLT